MRIQDLSGELQNIVRARIAAGGPITFRDYMDLALYHPELGYYSAGKVALGVGGDFTTSPEVDPAFGVLLARFVAHCDRDLGNPDPFTLSEFGSGSGRLLAGLLGELRSTAPRLYSRLTVHVVEASPVLRERQADLLRAEGHGDIVAWVDELAAGTGLVFSNEVVDAFPVHRVVMRAGELREIYVGLDDAGALADVEGDPSTPELARYFEESGVWPVEGQRTEVNLAARGWLENIANRLHRGFVLTIDYGDTADRLYSSLRPEGTLMSYTGGRVTDDPYSDPGATDITAHADFSALQRWGVAAGLQTVWTKRQMEFLVELGIGEMIAGVASTLMPNNTDAYRDLLAARQRLFRLIDPDGLGRFHVLLQSRGIQAK